MKYWYNLRWLSFFLYIVIFAAITSPPAFAAKHALLIGIENYLDTPHFRKRSMGQIFGPHNDLVILKQLFMSEPFQFPEQNIVTLVDHQATHTGIENAFKKLAATVQLDELVYIHFSGHGSWHDNFDGNEEISSKDKTWVTYGAADEDSKDSRDIVDDQINLWLTEISKKTDRIVFVSDSSHSVSVSRGPLLGVRAIGKDDRPYPKIEIDEDKPVGIRIGASGDTENAYEFRQGNKSYGRFTWHWVKSLSMIKPNETWSDVFQRTEALMREESMPGFSRTLQQPQIESQHRQHQNSVVLAGKIPQDLNRIIVTAIDDNNKVRLNAGHINNVTKGSIYAIEHAPDIATEVEITHVAAFSSEAKIINDGTVLVGDSLVERHHAYRFPPVPLIIEGDAILGQTQIEKLTGLIAAKLDPQKYLIVNERQTEGLIIRLFKPEQHNGSYVKAANATLPKSHPDVDLQAWVMNMQEDVLDDAMHVHFADPIRGINTLAKKMAILADLRDLKMLNKEPPEINVHVHQLVEDDTCNEGKPEDACFRVDRQYRIIDTMDMSAMTQPYPLPQNSHIGFSVLNNTPYPYYIYLLSMSIRNGVFVQFPYGHTNQEHAKIDAYRSKQLKGRALSFPNLGQEMVKVILSKQPLDLRALEFTGTSALRSNGSSKGPQSHMEKLLNRSARRATRILSPDPSEWGTIQAEMLIVAEEKMQ